MISLEDKAKNTVEPLEDLEDGLEADPLEADAEETGDDFKLTNVIEFSFKDTIHQGSK